jgi:hypothetical protein
MSETISEAEALRRMGRPPRTQAEQLHRDLGAIKREAERRQASNHELLRGEIINLVVRHNISGDPAVNERQTVTRSLVDKIPHAWLPLAIGGKGRRGFGIYNVGGDLLQTVGTEREAVEAIRRAQRKGF